MTPVDTYNAQADVDELIKGATMHKNLEVADGALLLFGNGDGGGGPTSLMLEKVRIHLPVIRPIAEINIACPP